MSHYQKGAPNCGNRRIKARELERLIWHEIVRFAENPGKVLRQIQRARAALLPSAETTRQLERQLQAKQRERARVITWAREGRIMEDEMDAQLVTLRAEIAGLEQERTRRIDVARSAELARARLTDAEAFFDELAGRLEALSDEERATVVRQLVPRVLLVPRGDGRVKVSATYAFAPPSITDTAPLRASV